MKAARSVRSTLTRVLRMGGTYRIKLGGVLVTAEDHEISGGRRTGRILVRVDDARSSVPVRWYCEPSDLEDMGEAPKPKPATEEAPT